ncbi:hypothetical protein PFISCL1PPCAC_383, partial [Pristionchus fissidentatus]
QSSSSYKDAICANEHFWTLLIIIAIPLSIVANWFDRKRALLFLFVFYATLNIVELKTHDFTQITWTLNLLTAISLVLRNQILLIAFDQVKPYKRSLVIATAHTLDIIAVHQNDIFVGISESTKQFKEVILITDVVLACVLALTYFVKYKDISGYVQVSPSGDENGTISSRTLKIREQLNSVAQVAVITFIGFPLWHT